MGREERLRVIPPWVSKLRTAIWITAPDRTLDYVNPEAEALVGRPAADCLGRPCFEIIAGRDASNQPFCGPMCPVFVRARQNLSVEPAELQIRGQGKKEQWIQALIIPIRCPGTAELTLIHCGIHNASMQRMEEYVRRVAARTPRPELVARPREALLSVREIEVLGLLAEDHSLSEIADELHVSYVTVRNHVQHILQKLGVHSTIEAVAEYLLKGSETPRGRG